jgi:hypothetical protein
VVCQIVLKFAGELLLFRLLELTVEKSVERM